MFAPINDLLSEVKEVIRGNKALNVLLKDQAATLVTRLVADDGLGSKGEIQRTGQALNVFVEDNGARINVDDDHPQLIKGHEVLSGVGTGGVDISPNNNGVFGDVCDIYVENKGSEIGEFRASGSPPGTGIKIPSKSSMAFTNVGPYPGTHAVAARQNTTDFLVLYTGKA